MCVHNITNEVSFRTILMGAIPTYHPLLYFFFLLLSEGLRYSILTGLSTQQQLPQLAHEETSVLPVQKSSQIDLHFLRAGKLELAEAGLGRNNIWSLIIIFLSTNTLTYLAGMI